jgi:monovalent cation:H+ antiporter, CPA1 family
LSVLNILSRGDEFTASERSQITIGGVKGAIVLALGLSLPLEFEAWYTVQSMVYGVVIFTLAVHPLIAHGFIHRGS